MAFHWSDNVHTTAFSPRDYQIELLAAAREKNLIICLGHNSSKEFIALKLIHELGNELRNHNKNKKISLYLTNSSNGVSAFNLIYHLTDLKVINLNTNETEFNEWDTLFNDYQVVILSTDKCNNALICSYIELKNVNLIVIEDCHKNPGNIQIQEILFSYYKDCDSKPKILGLAGPIHSAGCAPGRLGAELEYLEEALYSKAETASDIVTVLRYCSKPIEIILQCAPPDRNELTDFLRNLVITKKNFINDHRFDPSEIYEGFQDEIKVIPDPKSDPINFLDEFLDILNELGPWCADRAALSLLFKIENCKVKTPYERHFLLLCLISTTLVQIRSHCDYIFQKLATEKERIEIYSTPKVLRLMEILRLFKPENLSAREELSKKPNYNSAVNNNIIDNNKCQSLRNTKILEKIDSLDFNKLSLSIEKTKENVEKVEKSEKIENLTKSLNGLIEQKKDVVELNHQQPLPLFRMMKRNRMRNRMGGGGTQGQTMPRHSYHHHHHNNHLDSDYLCGIIFCNSKFIAKILFALFCELRRNDTDLSYLNVQYTVDKVANPLIDIKEAETEHRKQEDVLKRFRMHECNLLIGTSVLEEGIDLPKCNLVVRWDPPVTYRSYVQCKGRARAPHAYHIIMVAPKIEIDNENILPEIIDEKIHKFACFPGNLNHYYQSTDDSSTSSDESEKSNDEIITEINQIDSIKIITEINDEKENVITINKDMEVTEVAEVLVNSIDETELINDNNCIDYSSSQKIKCNRIEDDIFTCSSEININLVNDKSHVENTDDKINETTNGMIEKLAQYMEIEKMLLRKCENSEPSESELSHADKFTSCIEDFRPLLSIPDSAFVNLGTAVGLINKYCAKLPSDTFTKLTPLWRCAKTIRNNIEVYQCTLRLPINSPLKQDIIGLPMTTRVLARRMAALIACKILHLSGELDNNLQPIGKEGFKAAEPDWENFDLEEIDEQIVYENSEPRPGTTKRRQYYYKRIASAFSDCRPNTEKTAYLYHISMVLTCPIPEEQNTRGRKIYPPEDSPQGFGILTTKRIPKVSSFPIFTRSGEVKVSLQLAKDNVLLNDEQLKKIYTFINYTFTNVLRLQKYLMLFDPEATENCFFIVPTIKLDNSTIEVDWNFLNIISKNIDKMPKTITDNERKNTEFDPNKFKDAVVMPWYRNQDQPQYFYVAEICYHLSPESSFPGENYKTFQEYYFKKYNIIIQNSNQPLLDVDHTSARLNFLTPRYVNRKGVALPTSSEETKRAKRENLEQKQILVPELCTIHPFPASLWRAAVCLPCILYRINALLLADEIRKQVSNDLGLGKTDISEETFDWPTLDFGWSLADVLKKSRDAKLAIIDETDEEIKLTELVNEKKIEEINDNIIISVDENSDGKTANDILEEADRKLKSACTMEIGIWSNEMAENLSINGEIYDDEWGLLPPNVDMCSRSNTVRYGSPTSWNVTTKDNIIENYFSDSDDGSYQSDDDCIDITNGNAYCNDITNNGLRIEFKSDNVAEAIETDEEIIKREKQLAILNDRNSNETNYQNTKNIGIGFDCFVENKYLIMKNNIEWHENEYNISTKQLQENIKLSGMLIKFNEKLIIKNRKNLQKLQQPIVTLDLLHELIPYTTKDQIKLILDEKGAEIYNNKLTLDNIFYLNKLFMGNNETEKYIIEGSGDIFDNFNDYNLLFWNNKKEKEISIQFYESSLLSFKERNNVIENHDNKKILQELLLNETTAINKNEINDSFSFDSQPHLNGHPGPSPSIILQALTMSNANDGINLERLETIGDSFLKYAITTYLYCTYENVHEGKLSHLRSKQVSNLNLYRLGRRKILGESMIATKFEPHDNWLPPCYYVPRELEKALIEAKIPACHWNLAELPNLKQLSSEQICKLVKQRAEVLGFIESIDEIPVNETTENLNDADNMDNFPCFIPYNLVTQHSIPDKSVADCVEALIGAYLIECGPRGALLFMAWLGIRVLPLIEIPYDPITVRIPGSTRFYDKNGENYQKVYGNWAAPKSPLLTFSPNPTEKLEQLLDGYSAFETAIGYKFKDRAYLLQAMTHASYSPNRLTDCYQRLEFLGDAVLDYLITRHLYEDPRQHSPGALTDLRSALVNNTIFASLAVRHGFHKYFRHLSPGLNEVIDRFVRIQHENGHSISEEFYLLSEEECDEAEDVEVPKALGDVFESVAGAIFLDSNMSLDTVWKVYSNMMRPEIEQFSNSVPKSPIRELLELEPETAKFGKPEKLADGRRVRVTVEVFGKGTFRGIGRNYRIAKCTAAKCALRQLKKQGLISRKH